MLFTESQLQMNTNPFSILDEAVYLTEAEAAIQPQMVSIVENNRLQAYVVDFNGIIQLAESADIDYLDATILVLEQEGIDPSEACIAIDEADLIQFPELTDIGLPVVVTPISEQSFIYQVCEALTEEYLETEDEALLEGVFEVFGNSKETTNFNRRASDATAVAKSIGRHIRKITRNHNYDIATVNRLNAARMRKEEEAEEAKLAAHRESERVKQKDREEAEKRRKENKEADRQAALQREKEARERAEKERDEAKSDLQHHQDRLIGKFIIDKNKAFKAIGGTLAATTLGGLGLAAWRRYQDQPKSVIAKKIASLRSIYQKWMAKAQSSKDSGIAAKLRRGAAKILQVIDKLMAFLQRKADGK